MLRTQTLIAAAIVLLSGAFLLPACSVTLDSGPSCTNGSKDDGEEGVDCGGVCPTKCTGSGCTKPEECASGKCDNGMCGAPAGKPCGVGATPPTCDDGQPCELDKDCKSGFCDGAKCAMPAAGSHTDGMKNAGETGIDCGGSVKATQPCPNGQMCVDSLDCVGTCTGGICGPIGPMDGKKNGMETDVDCGGPTAPKCVDGKTCAADTDCATGFCPDGTKKCTSPTYSDGVKNGTETDVDCGGAGMGFKACAQGKVCKVDTDCNGACNYKKLCVDSPSCKPRFGGDTCGMGEFDDPMNPPNGQEDCCRTLEVKGFADPNQAGKKVYLDKYEITAGRMRAFLEAVGGGVDAAGNAKSPNVKAYMATHRPAKGWNNGWEDVLPTANTGSSVTYAIKNATVNMLYPGQDQYLANHPTQNTWWIGNVAGPQPVGTSVDHTIDVGIFFALAEQSFFPEYYAKQPDWTQGPDYAQAHALNCTNKDGAYGYATYWFDAATIIATEGSVHGKYFSKNQLDQKALNCTPNALFAAFCAWDGGQLATAEVMDNVTGNTVSPIYSAKGGGTDCGGGAACQNGKLSVGAPAPYGTASGTCGGAAHTLISYPDGGGYPCADVYYYPNDQGQDFYDGTSRIAPPGRVPADVIAKNAGDEEWHDLIGNLEEVVLKAGEKERFDYRGWGTEWSSIVHHHNQQSTPRGKGGAFGARCMRFK